MDHRHTVGVTTGPSKEGEKMKVNRSIVGFIDEDWCRCKKCSKKTMGKTIHQIEQVSVDGSTTNFWYCESCTEKKLQQADGAGAIHPKQPIWESMCTRSPIVLGHGIEPLTCAELTDLVWESQLEQKLAASAVEQKKLDKAKHEIDVYASHRLHLQAIGKESAAGSEATQPDDPTLIIRVDAPMDCDDVVCRDINGAYENIVKPGKD